jgi:Mitochondrial carrier protein
MRLLSNSSHTADLRNTLCFLLLLVQLLSSSASTGRRRSLYSHPNGLQFLDNEKIVLPCRSIGNTLLRGAFLRIASDLTGGTPLETIKTRVTLSTDGMAAATSKIVADGGVAALWTGSSSRTVEGALIGAVFMLGRVGTQTQLKAWGASPTVAALAGGLVGGVMQSVVMTPAGMIFTALNNQKKKKGSKKETAVQVIQRVVAEKGLAGMFVGMQPMCIRQATNWASRSGFTELARAPLKGYGIWGELGAGAIGGVGSCWNTPIETIRVYMQRDVAQGKNPKPMSVYWQEIVQEHGVPGLFRGVTPRAIQAIWQTVFLVVVPNLMGL